MADPEKLGKPWTDSELDEIVADYFVMLEAELSARPYVKAQHSAALMARIGRTHRSVEFKHQNISAVLEELGCPWILGYKPKKNYQQAIFGAIDRHLSRHPGILEFPVATPVSQSDAALEVFVDAPPPGQSEELPTGLRILVRKFDPVERDHRNRSLGRAGEEFVMGIERKRLAAAGRNTLADHVRWVAVEDGDGFGYDVLSFDVNGRELLIEVKTTNGSARTPFFLTRNERTVAADRPSEWRIYRVHRFASGPQIFTVSPPLEDSLSLVPESWRAVFWPCLGVRGQPPNWRGREAWNPSRRVWNRLLPSMQRGLLPTSRPRSVGTSECPPQQPLKAAEARNILIINRLCETTDGHERT